jgi:hypothetical protein
MRHARIGANATGAGSGAALLYLLKALPEESPWKQLLLYCSPAFSLAVRRGVILLAALLGEYVRIKFDDQQRRWDYKREKARLDAQEKELREILQRPGLPEESRVEVERALAKIAASRIEAVRRMSPGSGQKSASRTSAGAV